MERPKMHSKRDTRNIVIEDVPTFWKEAQKLPPRLSIPLGKDPDCEVILSTETTVGREAFKLDLYENRYGRKYFWTLSAQVRVDDRNIVVFSPSRSFGARSNCLEAVLSDVIPSATKMNILCEAECHWWSLIPSTPTSPQLESISTDMESFGGMCQDYFMSDKDATVILECRGVDISANTWLLSIWSPVFKAMFEDPWPTFQAKRVVIEDFDEAAVRAFLDYLQGDTLTEDRIKKHGIGIFKMAHKYDVRELRHKMEETLALMVNEDNLGELIILANIYESEEITHAVRKYHEENQSAILQTDIWKEFVKNNPTLK